MAEIIYYLFIAVFFLWFFINAMLTIVSTTVNAPPVNVRLNDFVDDIDISINGNETVRNYRYAGEKTRVRRGLEFGITFFITRILTRGGVIIASLFLLFMSGPISEWFPILAEVDSHGRMPASHFLILLIYMGLTMVPNRFVKAYIIIMGTLIGFSWMALHR